MRRTPPNLTSEGAERDERRGELPQEREARLVPDGLRRLVVGELGEPGAFLGSELGHTTHGTQGPPLTTSAPKVRRERAPGPRNDGSGLYLRRPTRSQPTEEVTGAKARTIAVLAGAALALAALAASPAGGAARRSIAAFADERGSGERDQGVADAEARPARPARPQREAPGVRRSHDPRRRVGATGADRVRRAAGAGWTRKARRARRGPPARAPRSSRTTSRRTRPPPRSSPSAVSSSGRRARRAGDMTISARSTLDNARLHVAAVDDTAAFYREDDDLDASSDFDVLGAQRRRRRGHDRLPLADRARPR